MRLGFFIGDIVNKLVLDLAIRGHRGQFRKFSGIDYIVHPIEVAFEVNKFCIRSNIKCDITEVMVNASIGHDLLEDTNVTEQEIEIVAGRDVLRLVKELTNPSKGSTLSRAERKKWDRDHLKNVSHEAKIIKLIDRTCNIRDMVEADDRFKMMYISESYLLLEALLDTDYDLELDLQYAIEELEETLK